jgi:hypothetical protein
MGRQNHISTLLSNDIESAGDPPPAGACCAAPRKPARISRRGLHWEILDEDISIAGLLAGLGDQSEGDKTFAA